MDQFILRCRVVFVDWWIEGDSIADDIIKGINSSSVVLVCLSQKYYESPYCKKGACVCFSHLCMP